MAVRKSNQPGKVFLMALDKLGSHSRKLVEILAFLNPDAVPNDILLTPNDDPSLQFLTKPRQQFGDIVYDPTESSLAKLAADPINGKKYLSIHRVLQDYLVYSLSHDPETDSGARSTLPEAFNQAFNLVRRATPEATPRMQPTRKDRKDYGIIFPQILSLATVYKRLNVDGTLEFAMLLSNARIYMWAEGLTKEGLQLLQAAKGVLDKIKYKGESLTRSRINTVISVLNDNVGISQRQEGLRRRESALRDRQAYQKRTAPQDFTQEDDILLHNAWADLACSYLQLHRCEGAEEVWEKCLLKYKEWGPPEKKGMAYEYSKYNHHMSFVRVYQQRFEEAIQLGELGVKYMIDSLGKDHPLVWRYKYGLACVLLQAGDKEKSLALHIEILETRVGLHGRSSELTLQSCYSVGSLYDYCGNPSQAEFWMNEAIQRQKLGKSFWPEELRVIVEYHLSRVLARLNKDGDRASELQKSALKIKNRLLGEDLPSQLVQVSDEMACFEHMLPVFNAQHQVTAAPASDAGYESSSSSAHSPNPEVDWVSQTAQASKADTRKQPRKDTFGATVDNRLDDGEDLVTVEKSVGGKSDPACPFRTQGSSLAA
ncbi:hypothetical protein DL98DRAFT_580399 [Cadophora sp. DSE1049]|nr:hypothetical protein DL98DRAFT_580399 [Cadophora sp. DSE1049]